MIDLSLYSGKNIAVFGLGKAGLSTVHALLLAGANVFVWDDGEKGRNALAKEKFPNLTVADYNTYDWDKIDFLVLSPGVPLTHPEPHPVVKMAKNCPIICDVELLYKAQKQSSFIGITGTNGKSTTTSLIGHILKEADVPTQVGGNIGIAALSLDPLDDKGCYVIEMSSYQLDLIKDTHFNISILLNITPDHIDRHGDMAGYIKAKKHIYDNQSKDDVAIIGVDDENCRKIYEEIKGKVGKTIAISVNEKLSDGISIIDGMLYDNFEGSEVIEIGLIERLPGKHNAQNIAAAYAAAKYAGVLADNIISGIRSFAGLAHRMQYVTQIDNVKFINDSKATNAEAASKALCTFDNIYWIAGGVAKEGGISSLTEYFPKIKGAYLIGSSQDVFADTIGANLRLEKCGDLKNAIAKAAEDAIKDGVVNAVVLLSPACASFDQWTNFEARGDAFCEIVMNIKNGKH